MKTIDIEQLRCLTQALYFESRGEAIEGQIAVAQVILNRVASYRFPNTICEVVQQKSQFSYYWDGKPETVYDRQAYHLAETLSEHVLEHIGHFPDLTKGALHYAVTGISRAWMTGLDVIVIGNHSFFY